MKMMIKTLMIAALSATAILTSCSSDEIVEPTGDSRAVHLRINRTKAETRAVGNQVPNGTAVIFNSGKLLFTDAGGLITKIVNVENNSNAYQPTLKTVGVGALEASPGQWFNDIEIPTTHVYFVGNIPADVTPPAENITNINTLKTAINTQWDNQGYVNNVSLFGGSILTRYTGANSQPDEYEAKFDVKPIVSRFEIKTITGQGDVTGFKIEGIFIDRYYHEMLLKGDAISTSVANNGIGQDKYQAGNVTGTYTTALNSVVYDFSSTAGGAAGLTNPSAGRAWGYNLFAPTSPNPAMPTIIIRLTDVYVNSVLWPSPQFLTVSHFYSDPGTNLNEIRSLTQGRVYVIPNLIFTEDDLTPEPYMDTKRVYIEIDVLDWESVNIGYDFH